MKDHLTQGALRAARAASLSAAAEMLEREAARLRQRADTDSKVATWHREMWAIPDMLDDVRSWVKRGDTEQQAIERIARHKDLKPEIVAYHYAAELKQSRSAQLWRRDREIMRLAWAGKTNAEIGARVGLIAKSVSRIVSEHLRNRRRFTQRSSALGSYPSPKEIAP
jgi:ATP/maltotriose-dependent transcriptional regulator MalT